MKPTDKDKPIYTTPKGAWEGGIASLKKKHHKNLNTITTDLQGNGYPITHNRHAKKVSV